MPKPFQVIHCACGTDWTQETHTVCPKCARWPLPKLRCLESLGDWISPDVTSRGPVQFSAGALNQMRASYRSVALVVDAALAFAQAEALIQSLKRSVRGKHCMEFSRGTFEAGYNDGSAACDLDADDDLCPNCKIRFEQRKPYKRALTERLRAKRRMMRLLSESLAQGIRLDAAAGKDEL